METFLLVVLGVAAALLALSLCSVVLTALMAAAVALFLVACAVSLRVAEMLGIADLQWQGDTGAMAQRVMVWGLAASMVVVTVATVWILVRWFS